MAMEEVSRKLCALVFQEFRQTIGANQNEIYKMTSTERIQMLEKELAVRQSKSLVIADVMQRELESCLRGEYTPENLPLLLLQYYTERITQLALSKYLMLRWKRFCWHSKIMKQLYLLYKNQVAYTMQKYSDALQRTNRLSVARENFLMGKNNPPNLVMQEDLTIYTKLLVCHLYSLRTIHHYLQACQYLPISNVLSVAVDEVPEVGQENENVHVDDISPDIQGSASAGPMDTSIPECEKRGRKVLATSLRKPEPRVCQIGLAQVVNAVNHGREGPARTEAAFVLPWHMTEREELKPQLRLLLSHFNIPYDMEGLRDAAKETELFSLDKGQVPPCPQENPALAPGSPSSFLPRVYDGISHTDLPSLTVARTIKPKCDPWQKKLLPRLKERRIDGLMQLQAKFLRLGLDDGVGPGDRDPVLMRGTYLSFLCLHHLVASKGPGPEPVLSLFQRICLGILNDFRSVERTLTINTSGLTLVAGSLVLTVQESSWVNMAKGGLGTLPGLGAHHYVHGIAERKVHSTFMEFSDVENQDDYYSTETGYIHPHDQKSFVERGLALVTAVTSLPGHKESPKSSTGQDWSWAHVGVDRLAVLHDLWTWEAALLENKCQVARYAASQAVAQLTYGKDYIANICSQPPLFPDYQPYLYLLDCYFEAYQHMFALAQVITDTMHKPRFDLSHPYFSKAYRNECICLRLHLQLVRASPMSTPALKNMYLLGFRPSLGLASLFPRALEHLFQEARHTYRPCWRDACGRWRWMCGSRAKPESWGSAQIQEDLFSAEVMRDPFLVGERGLLALRSTAAKRQNQGQDSHVLLLETFSKLLGLVTLRRQLTEMSLASAHLAWSVGDCGSRWQITDSLQALPPLCPQNSRGKLSKSLKCTSPPTSPLFSAVSSEGRRQTFMTHALPTLLSLPRFAFYFCAYSDVLVFLSLTFLLGEIIANVVGSFPPRFGLYKEMAWEVGFEEFHLYLRPVNFEFASHKDKVDDPPPIFSTSLLEETCHFASYGCSPPTLVLAISEVDDNQVGKFSFYTKEAILKLLFHSGVENMQVTLACQAPQKNALMVAVQNAFFYHTPRGAALLMARERGATPLLQAHYAASGVPVLQRVLELSSCYLSSCLGLGCLCSLARAPGALVSIQLEKAGLRGLLLNAFLLRKRTLADAMESLRYYIEIQTMYQVVCFRFNHRRSHYALQGQIMASCSSLRALLEDFPTIRDTFSMVGQPQEKKGLRDCKEGLKAEARKYVFGDPDWFACIVLMDTEGICKLPGRRHREGVSVLQELQKMIDSLRSPQDPTQVSQALLHREVMVLQFDEAARHLIQTFLMAGNAADQSVTGGLYHGLPPLSEQLSGKSIFAAQLRLPPPLVPQSPQASVLFPWRASLGDGGPFPVMSSSPDTLEYNMQVVVGMQLLMEDVLLSNYHVTMESQSPGWQATLDKDTQVFLIIPRLEEVKRCSQSRMPCEERNPDASLRAWPWSSLMLVSPPCAPRLKLSPGTPTCLYGFDDFACSDSNIYMSSPNCSPVRASGFRSQFPSSPEAPKLWGGPCTALALLRSFLVLWKPLEVLKEHWGRLKLRGQDISSVSLHKQSSGLSGTDISYPSLKALARRMGKEDEFEELIISSHSILRARGASKIKIKTQQLQKLLENLEIHMIQEVLRKVTREITLVVSEKFKEQRALPTGKVVAQGQGTGVGKWSRRRATPSPGGLHQPSLLQTDSFITLHGHPTILELDLSRGQSPPEDHAGQVAELSHNTTMEITALRAHLADLEEGNLNLEKQIRKEVQEEYEDLVKTLFTACLHMKKLNENQLNLIQERVELISEVRTEWTEHVKDLKKIRGPARPDEGIKEMQPEYVLSFSHGVAALPPSLEQLQDLEQENSRLATLVCKVRSLGRWRLAAQQAAFQLSRAQKVSTREDENMERTLISSLVWDVHRKLHKVRKKCWSIELIMAEQEAVLFRQQLVALRQALPRVPGQKPEEVGTRCLCSAAQLSVLSPNQTVPCPFLMTRTKFSFQKLLLLKERLCLPPFLWLVLPQAQLLKDLAHKVTQESVHRQQPDLLKTSSTEKHLEDVAQKEHSCSSLGQFQRKKLRRELRQVRSQLAQEHRVKLDTFQRVEELQSQLTDAGSSVQMSSPGGLASQAP
ncbi:LOW QUALITY PROTEIN: uncharacterized protein AAES06_013429 [Glossophaga mutica]